MTIRFTLPIYQSLLLTGCFILCLSSCATYKTKIVKEERNWSEENETDAELVQQVYLIGDAGKLHSGKPSPVLKAVEKKLNPEDKKQSLVYLGDNIYPSGMPPKDDPTRYKAEKSLAVQLDVIEPMEGVGILLPGNHDWYSNGLEGVKRQEDYVKKYLSEKKDIFLPADGCPGPVDIDISDDLALIVFDSKWMIEDFYATVDVNYECEVNHFSEFKRVLLDKINDHQDKVVLVVSHHPMESLGSHGGYFSARSHFFPLTMINEKLYIPVPGLGSFLNMLRINAGIREDITGEAITYLKRDLLAAANMHGRVIFASGHDHNLQLLDIDGHYQIVSGAGTKQNPTRLGGNGLFTTGSLGYSVLDLYDDGTTMVTYYSVDSLANEEIAFAKKLLEPQKVYDTKLVTPMTETEYSTSVYKGDETKGDFHRDILGKWYRELYYTDIEVPVFQLSKFQGGATPVKKGGGLQTNSLRLATKTKQEYVLRSLRKDAARFVGTQFSSTAVESLTKDFFTVSHPFGAYAIPPLAEAVNVHHTNPQLVYLPEQVALGDYNLDFSDQLYLLEERPDDSGWQNAENFGSPKDILSTDDMHDRILDKRRHQIDQPVLLRARLFDHLIGDWDRHQDQWRWAEQKDGDIISYEAIPRDRDQAFSRFDGLITGVVRRTIPTLRKFQNYSPDIKRVKWFNYNNRHVDRFFISELDWNDWEQQIDYLQAELTDADIEKGIKALPQIAQDFNGDDLISSLRGRRDNLRKYARKYYEYLAKEVDVVGTDEDDYFDIKFYSDSTVVRRYRSSDDMPTELYYHRSFIVGETQRINIWGLDEEDIFDVEQMSDARPIKLRIMGGRSEDTYTCSTCTKQAKLHVYDKVESTDIDSSEFRYRGLPDKSFYRPDWLGRDFSYGIGLPLPYFNLEDGVGIAYTYTYTDYGFKIDPFRSQHKLYANYVFRTQAFSLEYDGIVREVFGSTGLKVSAGYKGPSWNFNYFGLGNDTDNEAEERRFNRVRQEGLHISVGIEEKINLPWTFGAGLLHERYRLRDNSDRFVEKPAANVPQELFDWNSYSSLYGLIRFDVADDPLDPVRAAKLTFEPRYVYKHGESDQSDFVEVRAQFSMYHPISVDRRLRYAGKVQLHMASQGYDFFQAPSIGRTTGVRGLRQGRFRGDRSFAFTNDIYLDILQEKNVLLPIKLGIIGSFDTGRVWLDSEDSSTWHHAVGGGINLKLFGTLNLHGTYHVSDDDEMILVGLGRRF